MNKGKVYVGLSGGVDSSVAAALLNKEGYEVTGVFIKAWQPPFLPCTWKEDRHSAMRAAAALGIPFKTLDLGETYKREVVDSMVLGYQKGEIPNPDILCNEKIKFKAFSDAAFSAGADYIATGHYAILRGGKNEPELHIAIDPEKDQTYFLARISGDTLQKTLFPVGDLQKSEVRQLAHSFNLPTADRPDSQGLCFMGKLDVKEFLKTVVPQTEGTVLNLGGEVIGIHDGAALYTTGERHGFTLNPEFRSHGPFYVVAKDTEKNTLTVSELESPVADVRKVEVRDLHEISPGTLQSGKTYQVRFRYRQPLLAARFERAVGKIEVYFEKPIQYAAKGQSLAFYEGSQCLGSGILN